MEKIIGFDKTIEFIWLEKTAELCCEKDLNKIRKILNDLVEHKHSGKESRRKILTILKKIWIIIPNEYIDIRNKALEILTTCEKNERLMIHWGMCLLAYDFFVDTTSIVGRLLKINGTIFVDQIYRRIIESRGEKTTLKYAVQRLISTLYLWNILDKGEKKGQYSIKNKKIISNEKVKEWIVEVCIKINNKDFIFADSIYNLPFLFPFDLNINLSKFYESEKLEITKQGLNNTLISLK